MEPRVLVASLLAGAASAVIIVLAVVDPDTTVEATILNLCTEAIGIAVTVLILDRLAERRAVRTEARRIAWRALHDIDHAVWVWQGGARAFDMSELLALLGEVEDTDPVPQFTQNLLLRIGSRAEATLRLRDDITRADDSLRSGLTSAMRLATLRDSDRSPRPTVLAQDLLSAIPRFAAVADTAELPSVLVERDLRRDPAVASQEGRHFGTSRSFTGD